MTNCPKQKDNNFNQRLDTVRYLLLTISFKLTTKYSSFDECKREYFDSKSQLKHKLDQLAQWILESRHLIVFTGLLNDC